MIHGKNFGVAAALGCFGVLVLVSPASAQSSLIEACGNIGVDAEANCTARPPGVECIAACDGAFELQCSADWVASARANISVDCYADVDVQVPECTASCQAELENRAEINCGLECNARVEANCQASCAADANSAQCELDCKQNGSLECDASCDASASASLEAQCEAICEGELRAEASFDCVVAADASARAEFEASCQTDVELECQASCETDAGAVFCDDAYVEVSGVDQCLDAINNFQVEAEAYFNFEAGASVSCSVTAFSSAAHGGFSLVGAPLGLIFLTRRRRRRS